MHDDRGTMRYTATTAAAAAAAGGRGDDDADDMWLQIMLPSWRSRLFGLCA